MANGTAATQPLLDTVARRRARPSSTVTRSKVAGHVGDADPVCAISDTLHEREVTGMIISTLPKRLSRWMKLDLPSKVRIHGLPVTRVVGERAPRETAPVRPA